MRSSEDWGHAASTAASSHDTPAQGHPVTNWQPTRFQSDFWTKARRTNGPIHLQVQVMDEELTKRHIVQGEMTRTLNLENGIQRKTDKMIYWTYKHREQTPFLMTKNNRTVVPTCLAQQAWVPLRDETAQPNTSVIYRSKTFFKKGNSASQFRLQNTCFLQNVSSQY